MRAERSSKSSARARAVATVRERIALVAGTRAGGAKVILRRYFALSGAGAVGGAAVGVAGALGARLFVLRSKAALVAAAGLGVLIVAIAALVAVVGVCRSICLAACCNSSSNLDFLSLDCCAFKIESDSVSRKKMAVAYLVIFVRALPLPAPNKASVVPAPKACPMPASFLGRCTSTSKISNKQSHTNTKSSRY